jgi:hypothetical protein
VRMWRMEPLKGDGLLLQIALALRLPGRSHTSRRVSTHRTLLGLCSVVPAPSP